MTIQVFPDVIAGTTRQDGTGFHITRFFRVTGIATAADFHMLQALTLSQIPLIGAPHPRRSDITCQERAVEVDGNDPNRILVRCEYRPPDATSAGAVVGDVTRELRTELITEEVTEDLDGNAMITKYVSKLASGLGGSIVQITEQRHRVAVQRPSFSLVWHRIESVLPEAAAFEFSGTTNAQPYRNRPADTWLMNISATEDNSSRFRVSYTATYNSSGWQAIIRHNQNGLVPDDATFKNGIEERQVYPRTNFSKLGLP